MLEQDGAPDQEPTPGSQSSSKHQTRPNLHLFLRIIAKKSLKEATQAFVSQLHSSRSRIRQLQQSIWTLHSTIGFYVFQQLEL